MRDAPETVKSCWFVLFFLAAACNSSASTGSVHNVGMSADGGEATGCSVGAPPPTAPGGYFVNGNAVCGTDGQQHLFHGVDRPSLEYSRTGDHLSEHDFQLMASWGANVVRVGLNQDFWLEGSPQFDAGYAQLVDTVVGWAESAGLDVILDLHWSDAGKLGGCQSPSCQQLMADDNSITFWSQVAARYRHDGRVQFELYNEPHDISWEVWKSGGMAGGFHAAGMQQLYDAVRGAGADNLVLIGGLDWAYELSGVPANRISGYNIAYATHPYNTAERQPAAWDRSWGFLTATDPVVMTEFGNFNDSSCSTDYSAALIRYADAHGAGWTAWAWYPGGCTYPALIDDWRATPSASGTLVRAALLGYGGPHPTVDPNVDFPINYAFDHSTEGWLLNDYQDPDFTNLGAKVPPGVTPPTLTFNGSDGDPAAGSLELHVTITASDQYVIANAQVVADLTGKMLHARVRLKSGTLNGAAVSLHACTGDGSTCLEGPAVDPAALAAHEWAPLQWDLSTVTDSTFDATQVVIVGVLIDATNMAGNGSGLMNDGEAVLQVDSVTE